jgi:signal transduction histidine kinase
VRLLAVLAAAAPVAQVARCSTAQRARSEHVDFIAHAPVDLRELVDATAQRWTPAADRDWRVDIRADGTVDGDVDRLEAALDALIENAVKATHDGDRIALTATAEGAEAVIEVADTGTGIALEDVDRVFDRFWTASAGDVFGRGGAGLGLATVKAIAEAHGGHAEARPRPGGGTIFRMYLGRYLPAAERPGPSAVATAG